MKKNGNIFIENKKKAQKSRCETTATIFWPREPLAAQQSKSAFFILFAKQKKYITPQNDIVLGREKTKKIWAGQPAGASWPAGYGPRALHCMGVRLLVTLSLFFFGPRALYCTWSKDNESKSRSYSFFENNLKN